MGGTVAKYVKAGWTVHLLLATKGEAGKNALRDSTKTGIMKLRGQEVAEAAQTLGIASITYLEYQDGRLSTLTPGDLEDNVFRAMQALTPSVVITFEPNGISNHPDHIKMCYATTYAFQKYAKLQVHGEKLGSRDPRRYLLKEEEEESNEPKLYYACIPESVATYLTKAGVMHSVSFDKPQGGVPDRQITTVIDITRHANQKKNAIECHKTQEEDVERYLSLENHPLLKQEYFILRMYGVDEVFMGNSDRVANRL